jgi:hypothetical protein
VCVQPFCFYSTPRNLTFIADYCLQASSAFCAVLDPRNLQFLAFRCNEDCVAEMFSSFLETTAWHYTRPHHFRERRSLNNPYLSAHHVPVLTWSESKVPHAGVPSVCRESYVFNALTRRSISFQIEPRKYSARFVRLSRA